MSFVCLFVALDTLYVIFPGKGIGPGFSLSGRALALVRGGDANVPADINSSKNAVEMKGTLKNSQ